MTKPAILITGAGGFVGSHLAEGLSRLGYAVTALDRAFDGPTRRRLGSLRLIEGDLNRETLGCMADEEIKVVIHGAALTTSPELLGISELAHVRHNIDTLIDTLDAAVANGVECFIFLSSSGVFSFSEADVLDENTVPTGASAYALAKRAGEMIAGARPETLILRLGPLYGPHEASRPTRLSISLIGQWLERATKGDKLEVMNPLSRRDWTYLPDLAPAVDHLIGVGARGLLHLTSAESVSDLALAEKIASRHPGLDLDAAIDGADKRVPMISRRHELEDFAWTPLEHGLRLTAEAHP